MGKFWNFAASPPIPIRPEKPAEGQVLCLPFVPMLDWDQGTHKGRPCEA